MHGGELSWWGGGGGCPDTFHPLLKGTTAATGGFEEGTSTVHGLIDSAMTAPQFIHLKMSFILRALTEGRNGN